MPLKMVEVVDFQLRAIALAKQLYLAKQKGKLLEVRTEFIDEKIIRVYLLYEDERNFLWRYKIDVKWNRV